MNVFILTLGTRGDIQPYIALGLALQKAGHAITLCAPSNFQSFVEEYGLRYGYMTDALLRLLGTDTGRNALDGAQSFSQRVRTFVELAKQAKPIQIAMLEDGWKAAEQANPHLILFHPKAVGAPHFAEKLGVPAMAAPLVPMLVPTRAFPSVPFPPWRLGGWYNKLTARLINFASRKGTQSYIGAWRQSHGMSLRPRHTDLLHSSTGAPHPVLFGISPHVLPKPDDWPDHAEMIGYWFLDRLDSWTPPGPLADFLDAGDPPVYIGFGSMVGPRAKAMAQTIVEAVQLAKVRAVVATGWGGLDVHQLPDSIFKLDQAPHDWLFPRMAAIVHHGGAGTTAAGLRAGRPALICPFFGDQPFWGHRVAELGVGPRPLPHRRFRPKPLAAALEELVGNKTLRRNAEALGERLEREDGTANAVAFIESRMVGLGA